MVDIPRDGQASPTCLLEKDAILAVSLEKFVAHFGPRSALIIMRNCIAEESRNSAQYRRILAEITSLGKES